MGGVSVAAAAAAAAAAGEEDGRVVESLYRFISGVSESL
jgi:hypothetical protein